MQIWDRQVLGKWSIKDCDPLVPVLSISYKILSPSDHVFLVQFFKQVTSTFPLDSDLSLLQYQTVPKGQTSFFPFPWMEHSLPNYRNSISYISTLLLSHSLLRGLFQDTIVWTLCSFPKGVCCHGNMDGLPPLWTRIIEALYGMELLSVISLGFL